jgi:hypothetical protein
VLLVAVDAVGANGVPVRVGLLASSLDATADAIALNSVSISVPLTIFAGLPVVSVSFTAKLVLLM